MLRVSQAPGCAGPLAARLALPLGGRRAPAAVQNVGSAFFGAHGGSGPLGSKGRSVLLGALLGGLASAPLRQKRRGQRRMATSAASQGAAPAVIFPSNLEAVLFDIDGTLADTDPVHFTTFVDVLQREGFNDGEPVDLEFFKQRISGRQNRQICHDLFPEWDDERAEKFAVDKEATFRERAGKELVPVKGLDRLMDWCDAQGLKKAAVTNAPRLNAEHILDCINRRQWFQELIIGDECERAKPDPCPYLTAMERLGVRPERCIIFEDSPSGAQAAAASGAYTVGILTSQEPAALTKAGCQAVINSYEELHLWELLAGA